MSEVSRAGSWAPWLIEGLPPVTDEADFESTIKYAKRLLDVYETVAQYILPEDYAIACLGVLVNDEKQSLGSERSWWEPIEMFKLLYDVDNDRPRLTIAEFNECFLRWQRYSKRAKHQAQKCLNMWRR